MVLCRVLNFITSPPGFMFKIIRIFRILIVIKMSDNENNVPKRPRSSNYTTQEKNLLLNIVLRFKNIIESKKTDAVTWREKNSRWAKKANMFNSQSPSGIHRDMVSLKKAFENIKKNVRKTVADEKVSLKRTGGGEGYFNNDPTLDLALEVINSKTVFGISNKFDSDSHNNEQAEDIEMAQETTDPDIETVIIQMDNDLDTSAVETIDWGDFKASNLQSPVNVKLKSKSSTCQKPTKTTIRSEESIVEQEPATSWSAERRPITTALSSSDISKKYIILADLKIQLVKRELKQLETAEIKKEEREEIEFHLRKKSAELDIEIKKAILKKIASSSNPLDFLSTLK